MSSDTVTWIGTIVSIIGAVIAIWQACRAKSAAKRAEEMRNEIAGKHAHSELSVLDGLLAAACKAMDKYGPGRNPNTLRGTKPDSDADAVRAFTAALDRHSALLTKAFGKPCNDVRDRVNGLLDEFAAAPSVVERLPKGSEIYQEITIFSGNIKQAIDAKTFGNDAS